MDSYFDLRLYRNAEYSPHEVMGFVYEAVHMAIVDSKESGVGLSFPRSRAGEGRSSAVLGYVLRLHGQANVLDQLKQNRWFLGIPDLAQVGEIQPVPAGARFRIVRRVQPKTSVARLRRRYMKRHSVSETEAAHRIPNSVEERVSLPFVRFRSRSTGQIITLFIHHGELKDRPSPGQFSSYGLSTEASVPWF